jgi:hypothetical protein
MTAARTPRRRRASPWAGRATVRREQVQDTSRRPAGGHKAHRPDRCGEQELGRSGRGASREGAQAHALDAGRVANVSRRPPAVVLTAAASGG